MQFCGQISADCEWNELNGTRNACQQIRYKMAILNVRRSCTSLSHADSFSVAVGFGTVKCYFHFYGFSLTISRCFFVKDELMGSAAQRCTLLQALTAGFCAVLSYMHLKMRSFMYLKHMRFCIIYLTSHIHFNDLIGHWNIYFIWWIGDFLVPGVSSVWLNPSGWTGYKKMPCICITVFRKKFVSKLEISDGYRYCKTTFYIPTAPGKVGCLEVSPPHRDT